MYDKAVEKRKRIYLLIGLILLLLLIVFGYFYLLQKEGMDFTSIKKTFFLSRETDKNLQIPEGGDFSSGSSATGSSGKNLSKKGSSTGSSQSGSSTTYQTNNNYYNSSGKKTSSPNPSSTSSSSSSPSPTPTSTATYHAQMEGTEYKIAWDSINSGGGLSSSESYSLQDTVGEAGTGYSNDTDETLHGGYQQNEYLSISCSGDVDMGSIGGLTGGTMSGTNSCTVITDNAGGYTMSIEADTNPAFTSLTDDFANYSEGTLGVPDYNWTVASGNAEFGFNARGTDLVQLFKDNNTDSCNISSGSQTSDKCWMPVTTTPLNVAYRESANQPSGTSINFKFQAQSNGAFKNPGSYQALAIITAMAN